MKYILLLTFFYILFVILQYVYLKYFVTLELPELQEKIDWNIKNMDTLEKEIENILIKRTNDLKNKKLNYDEWIKYNIENVLVDIQGRKYYIFIFEMLENTNYQRLMTKVHGNPDYINLSWEDVLKDVQENLVNLKHTTDDNLIANMYDISDTKSLQNVEYYWLDPLTKRPVNKLSKVMRYYDPLTGRSGVIGMGIDLKDISIDNSYIYWQKINWGCPVFLSLLVYISSILLYKIKGDNQVHYKSVIFLMVINFYIAYFLGNTEIDGSSVSEQVKENTINSGILSVSFLFGVNIFILTTLQKTFKLTLFTEAGFLFSLSVLLLLFAMIKKTDNKTTSDITSTRLCTQLLFNSSIIINMLIIFNYILYVLSIKLGKNIIM